MMYGSIALLKLLEPKYILMSSHIFFIGNTLITPLDKGIASGMNGIEDGNVSEITKSPDRAEQKRF